MNRFNFLLLKIFTIWCQPLVNCVSRLHFRDRSHVKSKKPFFKAKTAMLHYHIWVMGYIGHKNKPKACSEMVLQCSRK